MSPPDVGRRWAQLTYSSFDSGFGAGGWQIKQTTGDLEQVEQDALRSRIRPQLEPVEPMNRFPTPAEIDDAPRRLLYVRTDGLLGAESIDGCGAYWHTALAGPDATGRPGNVFVQVLLDRTPSLAGDETRPIDVWRSADLLTPWGPDEVRTAVLAPRARPGPGVLACAPAVLDFLLDSPQWRIGTVAVLVDALAGCLDNPDERVVLGVDSPDDAAGWIAAACRLMAPLDARRLGFSTFERAESLDWVWKIGVQLAAVPRADLERVSPAAGLVLLDVDAPVRLGAPGGADHVTSSGSTISALHWSELTEIALQDHELGAAALDRLDVIAGQLTGRTCDPAWPLAAALADDARFADAADAVADVLLVGGPRDLGAAHGLKELMSRQIGEQIGGDPRAAWAVLEQQGSDAAMADMVAAEYVGLTLEDSASLRPAEGPREDWLTKRGGAPVPRASVVWTERYDRALNERLDQLLPSRSSPLGPLDRVTYTVLVADFVARLVAVAGCDVPSDALRELADLVGNAVAPMLTDIEFAHGVIDRTGELAEPGMDRFVRPALEAAWSDVASQPAASPRPLPSHAVAEWVPLHRPAQPVSVTLPADVLEWLYPELGDGDTVDTTRPSMLLAEFALAAARREGRELTPRLRALAIRSLLTAPGRSFDTSAKIMRLARPALPARELIALMRDFGSRLPSGCVLVTLRDTGWSGELGEVAESVVRSESPMEPELAQLARVRLAAHTTITSNWFPTSVEDAHRVAAWAASLSVPPGPVATEFAAVAVAAMSVYALALASRAAARRTPAGSEHARIPPAGKSPDPLVFGTRAPRVSAQEAAQSTQRWSSGEAALPPMSGYVQLDAHAWDVLDLQARTTDHGFVDARVRAAGTAGLLTLDGLVFARIVTDPEFPHWPDTDTLRRFARLRFGNGDSVLERAYGEIVGRLAHSVDAKYADTLIDEAGLSAFPWWSEWEYRDECRRVARRVGRGSDGGIFDKLRRN